MKLNFPLILLFVAVFMLTATACSSVLPGQSATATPALAKEIILYDWIDDMPVSVFQDFEKEYGVAIKYIPYESQEEAIESMKAGNVYDIVVLDTQFIPGVISGGMVRQINYQNVQNFKYISANFRDLVYDPDNRYSIPYNWGTTGLVIRSDLVEGPVTRWEDLWKQEAKGKVLVWRGVERQMMGMALKSLGYSVNSENPAEIEGALQRLLELKPNCLIAEDKDESLESSAPVLLSGEAVMAVGWSHDVLEARLENPNVDYVLPEEGGLLWGDNFVIPTNSQNPYTAELFLNYLLRPEVSAQLTNYNSYPTPHDKAGEFVDPAIFNDPVVYPKDQDLKNAEIILPLSAQGEALHDEAWERFLTAP